MSSRQLDEEAIFHVARDIASTDSRSRYLDQICAGDQTLRERVEALLDAHEQARGFLKSNLEIAPTVDHAPLTERPGASIGRYKLMEQIGEGGMGTVFVAEQERPIRRKVALKVIKPGMDSKAVVARFEAERQALAMMDHPNIAKVLDAGTTDAGRPYFVMELVKGVPIIEYCDRNRLTIRERLELFIQVCQAIQHAHQKGIIHRDIKPSNVLVTLHDGKPVPKVIDFGVAKALNTRLTDKTIYTEHFQVVGTLLYMSPEQAELSGLDIDTRSDIYSLGVMLFELLTGTTPFEKAELDKAGFDEQRKIIRDQEPPRASVRISSLGKTATIVAEHRGTDLHNLGQLVRGDLDWIVLKALEKDRTRRYETATGLGEDVARFLANDLVVACPPSAGYRLRKFVGRNKSALATGLLIATVLVIGLIGTTWQAIVARAEVERRTSAEESLSKERVAKREANTAQQLAELSRHEAERQLASAKANEKRAQIAEAMATQQRQLAQANENRARVAEAMATQQRQLAQANLKSAEVQRRKALSELETIGYEQALTEALMGNSDQAQHALKLAESTRQPSDLHVLRALLAFNNGDPDEACQHCEKAIEFQPDNLAAHAIHTKASVFAGYDERYESGLKKVQDLFDQSKGNRSGLDRLLLAMIVVSSDAERGLGVLNAEVGGHLSPFALSIRGEARIALSIEKQDPIQFERGLRDLEYVQELMGKNRATCSMRLYAIANVMERAQRNSNAAELRRYREQGSSLEQELADPEYRDFAGGAFARWLYWSALGNDDQAWRSIRLAGRHPGSYSLFIAADRLANAENRAQALKDFDEFVPDRTKAFPIIARSFLSPPDEIEESVRELIDESNRPMIRRFALYALCLTGNRQLVEQAATQALKGATNGERLCIECLGGHKPDLMKVADAPKPWVGHFTLGMRALAERRVEDAAKHFQRSDDSWGIGYFEAVLANACLERMKIDKRWPYGDR